MKGRPVLNPISMLIVCLFLWTPLLTNAQVQGLSDYRLLPKGRVEVINQCRTANGQMDVAKGSARFVGPEGSPKFEVRFVPEWMEFIPMVWGKYWVVDLDKDYTLAAVSEPSREYLWILSRTPTLDEKRWNALLNRLESMGLSIGKLERTPHNAP